MFKVSCFYQKVHNFLLCRPTICTWWPFRFWRLKYSPLSPRDGRSAGLSCPGQCLHCLTFECLVHGDWHIVSMASHSWFNIKRFPISNLRLRFYQLKHRISKLRQQYNSSLGMVGFVSGATLVFDAISRTSTCPSGYSVRKYSTAA